MASTTSKTDQILAQFPGPVTLHQPLWENALLFVGSALFTAGGYWMVTSSVPKGWFAFLFFGLCTVIAIGLLLSPYALTLDAEGYQIKALFRRRRTSWQNLSGFKAVYIPGLPRSSVGYCDSQIANRKMMKLNQSIWGCDDVLPNNCGLSARELAELMTLWQAKAMSSEQSQSA